MSHDIAQTSGRHRFDVSVDDFRKQAEAIGFWRGLGVGFVSAFFLFDAALAQGAAVGAIVGFVARNGVTLLACAIAVVATAAAGRGLAHALRAERARRGKLKQVRERLGI